MTAIKEYTRLESTGLWRATPDAQRREVVVSFGKASLILSDMNEVPLTHWSLAAVQRHGNSVPALYSAGEHGFDTLEIDDPLMVEAIETVRRPFQKDPPRSGSLRLILFCISMALVGLVIWLWLPNTLAQYATRIAPPERELEIGNNLLGQIERFTGRECTSPSGDLALAQLHGRVLPGKTGRIRVAELGAQPSLHLPGDIIILHIAIVEGFSDPAVAAGHILSEDIRREATPPLLDFLQFAGLRGTIWFLTSGEISDATYESYARHKITTVPSAPEPERLLERFAEVTIPSAPFAYAEDPSGQKTKLLIDLNPVSNQAVEVIDADDWLALQAICDA
ncbi:MAG: hypothetical protein AAGA63_03450 [Pseudomonadota bacterium]